jgi:hypothetical protein
LVGEFVVFNSQPSDAIPLQLANPELHDMIEQIPAEQLTAVAFIKLHAWPHVPQLETVTMRFISQPSLLIPLQFANPALHAPIPHTPAVQTDVPLATIHVSPHWPQLFMDMFRFVSHPSAGFPLQFAKEPLHKPMEQNPMVQAGVALAKLHTVPHAPQLLISVVIFISQPSFWMLLQLKNPALHPPISQTPAVQVDDAFGNTQLLPQPPQLNILVRRLTSQPSPVMLLQLANPPVHELIVQTPPVHAAVALGYGPQTFPHEPQLAVVVKRLQIWVGTHWFVVAFQTSTCPSVVPEGTPFLL